LVDEGALFAVRGVTEDNFECAAKAVQIRRVLRFLLRAGFGRQVLVAGPVQNSDPRIEQHNLIIEDADIRE
jgi:hypothetical protein